MSAAQRIKLAEVHHRGHVLALVTPSGDGDIRIAATLDDRQIDNSLAQLLLSAWAIVDDESADTTDEVIKP